MNLTRKQSIAPAQDSRRHTNSPIGFTLVELLAVLAIMALLMAVTIPAFLAMGKGSKFDVALSELRATLSQARQWAITHRVDTYIVFPDDTPALYSNPDEARGYALRSYNAYTDIDGYVREWTFLPPGIFFVNQNGYKGTVSNTVWILDDKEQIPFPETTSGTKNLPFVGFKPDGTRMGSGFTRVLYLGEGIVDETGLGVTYLPETDAVLFGLEVSQFTGGVRVRDYQDR